MSGTAPQVWRDRAVAAAQAGNAEGAKRLMTQGLAEHPRSAELANSAGNLHMRLAEAAEAERLFARALALAPRNLEFALNRAIALGRVGRDADALCLLRSFEREGSALPRYCSARAAAERSNGDFAKAAEWYQRCLALDPVQPRALHGRARLALERGEMDSVERFDRALARNSGDAELWLGKAQALDVTGDAAGARQIAEALVEQAPHWTEGLRFLAQLRLAAGESDFASHYADAAKRVPRDPAIPFAWCGMLSGLGFDAEARGVAAAARERFPNDPRFVLLEAVHAGAAGDDDRAEDIFTALDLDTPERWLQEARHRIRRHSVKDANALLDRLLKVDPWNISGWALRGIAWRMAGDERSEWLHGQAGLVRLMPLADAGRVVPDLLPLLHRLHDGSPLPLGQSLRGGTQTRGVLFARTENPFRRLKAALLRTIDAYRETLPQEDGSHPLLRHRAREWKLAGSWSVRLSGGGDHHTAHIHPQGIVSSALYLELPPSAGQADEQAGWLELGRPPPDLRLDLPPLAIIKPEEGHLALFPSTLYHGTRPFQAERRLTVAFDIASHEDRS